MAAVQESPAAAAAANGAAAGNGAAAADVSAFPVTICVGDLHGHVERTKKLWANLERRIGREKFRSATVIFLGDYNDRGPNTKALLDWLIALPKEFPDQKRVFLAGNHDFSFAAFTGCLPPGPPDFDYRLTWPRFEADEEREGWYKGPGYETMHVQGRRWAGLMKERLGKKGRPVDMSTFDSGSTFRSYGVPFADREALLAAMPQEHKDFLRSLVWVHEEDGIDTGDPATSYSKLIAVHAGFQAGMPADEQVKRLKERSPTTPRVEELCGRANVYENLPEHDAANVLVVSGHHGVLDTSRRLRQIIDQSGGLDLPIAALVLPSKDIVRDIDEPEGVAESEPAAAELAAV